jgi:hypothetical protein
MYGCMWTQIRTEEDSIEYYLAEASILYCNSRSLLKAINSAYLWTAILVDFPSLFTMDEDLKI